ncbi:hypothetical protein AVEN_195339-1 [Araneus ventricosus]|uniref:Uncharacterized protein n=1 Tax=Araneus ventricosus TaxID=182803 RepID=A0A4Y2NPV5_ARAVE|nr:hypothetical protein AVEN_249654-1 [Araneus ventricosus]GBN41555.1 hypothetical protein AVEN_54347-1 [Araneus ventricosus]GBN42535.1 hypothetical protein AVEN_164328-1 [Araneus ventricosus]GBN42543.1 hypothetical protein AVEN_195339-1 [Araneus ventricosus]
MWAFLVMKQRILLQDLPLIFFPYCDIKKFLVSHLLSVWQQKWNLLTRNKPYPVKPSIGLWPALPMRELDVKLTRLRRAYSLYAQTSLLGPEGTKVS